MAIDFASLSSKPLTKEEIEKKIRETSVANPALSSATSTKLPIEQRFAMLSKEPLEVTPESRIKPFDPIRYPKEAFAEFKSFYGGGPESVGATMAKNLSEGTRAFGDAKTQFEQGQYAESAKSVGKGVWSSGVRIAGDVAGALWKPIGLLAQATGVDKPIQKVAESLVQKPTWDTKSLNMIEATADSIRTLSNLFSDSKVGQEIAKNLSQEDAQRLMDIALTVMPPAGAAKIDVATMGPRTVGQLKTGVETIRAVPEKIGEARARYAESRSQAGTEKTVSEIEAIATGNKSNKTWYESNPQNKQTAREIAETTDLRGTVTKEGTWDTTRPREQIQSRIEPYESEGFNMLEKANESTNLARVENKLTEKLADIGVPKGEIRKTVTAEMKDLKLSVDELGNIKLTELARAKTYAQRDANSARVKKETNTQMKKDAIARAYREAVLDATKTEVGKVWGEQAKLYRQLDFLQTLNGAKVEGGRLGKYFAEVGGYIGGAAVGTAVAGPVGTIGGIFAGRAVARSIRSQAFTRKFSGSRPVSEGRSAILERAKTENALPRRTKLNVPDRNVGAPRGTAKTKEVLRSEGQIRKNVEAQKQAIKEKDWTRVHELKKQYESLTEGLKQSVKGKKPSEVKALVARRKELLAKREKRIQDTVSEMRGKAKESVGHLDEAATTIEKTVGGTVKAKTGIPVKSQESAVRKVKNELQGDATKLNDLARNSITYRDAADLPKVLKEMDARTDLAKPGKHQTPEEYAGYEGYIYKIKTPNGLIGETQVLTEKMLFGKVPREDSVRLLGERRVIEIEKETGVPAGKGHEIYEKIRDEIAKGRKDNPELKRLIQESVDYYSKLREKTQGGEGETFTNLYRGIGYKPNDFGVAGKGEYWSGRRQGAEAYAEKELKTGGEITLKKPLKLEYSQLNALQKRLYGKVLTGFEKELSQKFHDYLIARGYDGVVLYDYSISRTIPEEVVKLIKK